MSYASFELLPEQQIEKESIRRQKQSTISQRLESTLRAQPHLRELNSDILGMSSYYYDPNSRKIYEHNNVSGTWTVNLSESSHLMELNHLN